MKPKTKMARILGRQSTLTPLSPLSSARVKPKQREEASFRENQQPEVGDSHGYSMPDDAYKARKQKRDIAIFQLPTRGA
jgi:hypothetical protein